MNCTKEGSLRRRRINSASSTERRLRIRRSVSRIVTERRSFFAVSSDSPLDSTSWMRGVVFRDKVLGHIHRWVNCQDSLSEFADVENHADASLRGKTIESFADLGRDRADDFLVTFCNVGLGLLFLQFQIFLKPPTLVLFGCDRFWIS